MGDPGQVHDLLDTAVGQQCKTGLPGGVHVGMVSEDRKGVGRHRSGAHVEHAGKQFTGDFVHVGDHQQKSL